MTIPLDDLSEDLVMVCRMCPFCTKAPPISFRLRVNHLWVWLRASPCGFLRAPAQIACPLSCAVSILSIGVHVLGEDCDVSYYIGKRLKLSYIIAIISSLLTYRLLIGLRALLV